MILSIVFFTNSENVICADFTNTKGLKWLAKVIFAVQRMFILIHSQMKIHNLFMLSVADFIICVTKMQ